MSVNNQTFSPELNGVDTSSHPPHEEPIQSFLNQFIKNPDANNDTKASNSLNANPSNTLPSQANNLLSLFSMAKFANPNANNGNANPLPTHSSSAKTSQGFNTDKDASQNLLSLLTQNIMKPSFPSDASNTPPTQDSPSLPPHDSQNVGAANSSKSQSQILEESSNALKSMIVGSQPKSEGDFCHYYQPTAAPTINGTQDNPLAAFAKMAFALDKKQGTSDNSLSASEAASVSPHNVPLPATPQSEKSSRAISPKSFFNSALSANLSDDSTSKPVPLPATPQLEKNSRAISPRSFFNSSLSVNLSDDSTSKPVLNNGDLNSALNIESKVNEIQASPFDNSNLFDLLEDNIAKISAVGLSQGSIEFNDQVDLESIPSAIEHLEYFTVSHVTSEADLSSGQLISSYCGLISYAMKSGKVRLIHQKDGYRALLRDEKSSLIDIKLRKCYTDSDFNNGQKHRLVTLSKSNQFIIWDIQYAAKPGGSLDFKLTYKIDGTPEGIQFLHSIFHPTQPNTIAVSCSNNQIFVFNTDAFPSSRPNPSLLPSQLAHATTVLSGLDDEITSLCFSPDGSYIFAGTKTGIVGVWNWSNSPHPLLKFQTNVHLPISYIHPCQPTVATNKTTLLPASYIILGFNHNLNIQLWDLTSQMSLHTIQFKISKPLSSKQMNVLQYDPTSEILYVGCNSRSSILLFHLKWVPSNISMSRFDYSIEYSCPDHILSMDISSDINFDDPQASKSVVLYVMHGRTIQMYTISESQLHLNLSNTGAQRRSSITPAFTHNLKSNQLASTQSTKQPQPTISNHTKTKSTQKSKKNSEAKANTSQPSLSLLSMGDFKPVEPAVEKPKGQPKESQPKVVQIERNEKVKVASDTQKLDQLSKTITKSIDSINQNVNYTLSNVVPASIQRGVSESIQLSLEQQVPNLMDQYFTGPDFQRYLDSMIQHHVQLALQSDTLIESITTSITNNVISGIQGAFQSSFTSLLIPAYQKATQNMFKQMQCAFENGLKKNFDEIPQMPPFYPTPSMAPPNLPHLPPHNLPRPHPPPHPHPHSIPPQYPMPQHAPTHAPNQEDNAITRFLQMNNGPAPPPNMYPGPNQPHLPFPQANVNRPSPPITQPTTPPSHQNTTIDPNLKSEINHAVNVKDTSSILSLISNQNTNAVFSACQFSQRDLLGIAKLMAKDLNQQTPVRLQILQEAINHIDSQDPTVVHHIHHFLEFVLNQCNSFEQENSGNLNQWSQLPIVKSLIQTIKNLMK